MKNAGKTQGIRREYAGNTQGIRRENAGNTQGIRVKNVPFKTTFLYECLKRLFRFKRRFLAENDKKFVFEVYSNKR
jgi:hypothetical protein